MKDEGMNLPIEKIQIDPSMQPRAQIRRDSSRLRRKSLKDDTGCFVCGFPVSSILRLHHRIPVSKDGTNDPDNLIFLCPNCHDTVHDGTRRCFTRVRKEEDYERGRKRFDQFIKDLRDAYSEDEIETLIELARQANGR
jgi:5-methylcytosine-specific restriction endonuclease McrA